MKKKRKYLVLIGIICLMLLLFFMGKSPSNNLEIQSDTDLPVMCFVEGDTFDVQINLHEKVPPTKIYVDDFSISETPITVGQFAAFVNETGHITFKERYLKGEFKHYITRYKENLELGFYYEKATWKTDNEGNLLEFNMPVVNVSFSDIYAYCEWLSKKIGKKIELPTQSEWYFAAIGGKLSKKYIYPGSNNVSDVYPTTNIKEMKRNIPFPVKQKIKNELGLYDFLGSVMQLVTGDIDIGWNKNRTDSITTILLNPSRDDFVQSRPVKLQIKDFTIINPQITEPHMCGNPSFYFEGENELRIKFRFNEFAPKLDFTGLKTNMAWTGSEFLGFRVVGRDR